MHAQSTAVASARKPVASQVAVAKRRPVVSPGRFVCIVARLRAGERERSIAASEQLPEIVICRIRQLSLDAEDRKMSAVGLAVGTMLDTVRQLHKEIDEGCYEEINEGAA